MGMKHKLHLRFEDRVGIVADLSVLLARQGLNILSMEVQQKGSLTDIYFEAESHDTGFKRETPFGLLSGIKGLTEVRLIKNLPHKIREDRFRVVLDNIVGAVKIAKNMKEIRRLAKTIWQPATISFSEVIGEHPAIQEAIALAQKIATTDSVVSIRGESGTGKELFAQAIHTASHQEGPFVPIDCAALPESLLESELFGYAGGAFSSAGRDGKPGLFEIAHNGTLFLDAIGEMPAGPQAKILRAIQDKCVRRIGGDKKIPVKARIITATKRNLEKMVQEKKFRQDLYYRINVLPIHIAPLRERISDIPMLADHFLFQLAAKLGQKAKHLDAAALQKLENHDWPGNIRELKNVIERAAVLSEADEINTSCILFSFGAKAGSPHHLPNLFSENRSTSLAEMIAAYEREILKESLAKHSSIRKASKTLGISHTTLINKIKKQKINVSR